ncbi:MAG TPA: hypothetical protein VGI16_10050 [Candidatus Acidoferrum sp.]|jgi:hypothetical protein
MNSSLLLATLLIFQLLSSVPQQTIPKELWGTWIVQREIPTRTITCWDERQAKKLIGTQIEYSATLFRWNKVVTRNPIAEVTTIGARQFQREFGRGRE